MPTPIPIENRILTQSGLSQSTVLRRQEEEGFNELPTSRPEPFYHIAFEVLREPMVYLLLGCGLVYFFIGDQQESFMLLGFLGLIVGITIFQEQKAERALEALRELSSPRAQVMRGGLRIRVAGRDLVREDLIFLNEGDRVPADAELIEANQVKADESLLTGAPGDYIPPNGNIGMNNDGGWCQISHIFVFREVEEVDTMTLVTPPSHGEVRTGNVGKQLRIAYRPAAGFTGIDNFVVHLATPEPWDIPIRVVVVP